MIKEIKCDVFKATVVYFIGEETETVRKYIEDGWDNVTYLQEICDTIDKVRNHTIDGMCGSSDGMDHFIYVSSLDNMKELTHETLHAVTRILDKCGIKPSWDSEEVYCYLLEYFIGKLLNKD